MTVVVDAAVCEIQSTSWRIGEGYAEVHDAWHGLAHRHLGSLGREFSAIPVSEAHETFSWVGGGNVQPNPLPDPKIPGFVFPEKEETILDWVAKNNQAAINLHGWGGVGRHSLRRRGKSSTTKNFQISDWNPSFTRGISKST
jgi:hypothetical protein